MKSANESSVAQPMSIPGARRPPGRCVRYAPLVATAALYAGLLVPLRQSCPVGLSFLFHDDSFFYLQIAQNVWRGHGSTFDQVTVTNGYHPLYLLLLAGANALPVPWSTGLLTVVVIDSVLLFLGIAVMNAVLSRYKVRASLLLICDVICVLFVGFNDFGIEVRLLFPLVWLFVYLLDAPRGYGVPSELLLGFSGAVVVLTRLDAWILIVCVIAVYRMVPAASERDWTGLVRSGLVPLALPAVALVLMGTWNWHVLGHFATISGWLKTGFPGALQTDWLGSSLVGIRARFGIILFVALATGAYSLFGKDALRSLGERRLRGQLLLIAFAVSNVVYLGVLFFYIRGGIASWYFAVPLALSIASWAVVAHDLQRRAAADLQRRIQVVTKALALLIIAAGCGFAMSKTRACPLTAEAIAFADRVRGVVALGSRVFQVDGSGRIGYFSNRRIINGDGLVNNFEYQEYLRSGRLKEYVAAKKVRYIITNAFQRGRQVRVSVPLWDGRWVIWDLGEIQPVVQPVGRFALFAIDSDRIAASQVLRSRPPAP